MFCMSAVSARIKCQCDWVHWLYNRWKFPHIRSRSMKRSQNILGRRRRLFCIRFYSVKRQHALVSPLSDKKHINQLFCDIVCVTSNQKSEYERKSTVNLFSWLVTGFRMAETEVCDWWLRIGNVTKCEGLVAAIDGRWNGNKSIVLSRLDLNIWRGRVKDAAQFIWNLCRSVAILCVQSINWNFHVRTNRKLDLVATDVEIMNEIRKSNNLSDQYCP